MLIQIAFGTMVMSVSVLVTALAAWALDAILSRSAPWIAPYGHRPHYLITVLFVSIYVMAMIGLGVCIWTFAYLWLGVFPKVEEALYFALECFTTLGMGDVRPPPEWRLLGGMTAINGSMNFGISTALLVGALQRVRSEHPAASGR
jgi:Ion channel